MESVLGRLYETNEEVFGGGVWYTVWLGTFFIFC